MATPMLLNQMTSLTNLGIALGVVFNDQITNLPDREPTGLLSLFNVQNSSKTQEVNLGIGGFGNVPEYKGTIEYDDFDILYPAYYIHKEYAKGFAVERKLWDDGMYNVIRDRANLMGIAFDRTKEIHAASVFNNMFSSSYLGPDSKALAATDHPYGPNNTTTQSNKGTTALSHDAVITARTAMRSFVNSIGEPVMAMPDTLVVPTELEAAAQVIVGSNQKPGTANNDTNVLSGMRVLVSPYLTDANNWFLVDSRLAKARLRWYWRVLPEFKEDPSSDYNLVMKYRGYMRYSFGWDTYDWVYGSEVA
jgi:hypothetical protein